MPTHLPDPTQLSSLKQLREPATLLAASLLRLRTPSVPPDAVLLHAPDKLLELRANELTTGPNPSATGHAG
jgi:hypothetical protein